MMIPESILRLLGTQKGTANTTGLSGSSVIVYDDCVLKIEKQTDDTESAIAMMRWLERKVPVPRIFAHENVDGTSYLLMSKARGCMSCNRRYMEQPYELMSLLAEGMKQLWQVDTTDCPKVRSLDEMLAEAEYRVANNLVDMDLVEPETFGEKGFRDPAALLDWLVAHKPQEEWALTHGDYCLPNIFLNNGTVSCFIDIGDMARSDRWRDIALCWRSMNSNFAGAYGGPVYHNPEPEFLFKELDIEPDWDKIRWHILLDELF